MNCDQDVEPMNQTPVKLNQRVRMSEDVLFRELDGEAVLLNLADESYYGLDEVGTRMWLVLEASESVNAALSQLLSEYDVDPELLKADMLELIAKLKEHGLVFVDDA
jgi:hypothetical protein